MSPARAQSGGPPRHIRETARGYECHGRSGTHQAPHTADHAERRSYTQPRGVPRSRPLLRAGADAGIAEALPAAATRAMAQPLHELWRVITEWCEACEQVMFRNVRAGLALLSACTPCPPRQGVRVTVPMVTTEEGARFCYMRRPRQSSVGPSVAALQAFAHTHGGWP